MRHLRFLILYLFFCLLPLGAAWLGVETWLDQERESRRQDFILAAETRIANLRDRINFGSAQIEVMENLLDELSALKRVDSAAIDTLLVPYRKRWPGLLELRYYRGNPSAESGPATLEAVYGPRSGKALAGYLADLLYGRRLVDLDSELSAGDREKKYPGLPAAKEKLVKKRFLGEERSLEYIASRPHDAIPILPPEGSRILFWDITGLPGSDGQVIPSGLAMIMMNPEKGNKYFIPETLVREAASALQDSRVSLGIFRREGELPEAVRGLSAEILRDVSSFTSKIVAFNDRQVALQRLSETGEDILYSSIRMIDLFPEEATIRLWKQIVAITVATVLLIAGFIVFYGIMDLFISLQLQVAALFLLAALLPLSAIIFGGMKYLEASRENLFEDAYRKIQTEVFATDDAARAYTANLQRECQKLMFLPGLKLLAEGNGSSIPAELKETIRNEMNPYLDWAKGATAINLFTDYFIFGQTGEMLLDSSPGTRGLEVKLMRGLSNQILEYNNKGVSESKEVLEKRNAAGDLESEFLLKTVFLRQDMANNSVITQRGRIHRLQVFGNDINFFIEPLLDNKGVARHTIYLAFLMKYRYFKLALDYIAQRNLQDADGLRLMFWLLPPDDTDQAYNDYKVEIQKNRAEMSSMPAFFSFIKRISRDRDARRFRFTHDGQEWLAYASPLRVVNTLMMTGIYPVRRIEEELTQRREYFLYAILFSLLITLLASWGVSRRFLMPVAQVQHGVDAIAEGDLGYRMKIDSNDELGRLSDTFNSMVGGLQEKERMSRYVSDFVREAVKTEASDETLGETMKATVLFSDIRGFTTLSENHPPTEIVAMLNEYLERMTVVIQEHGGVVDKFIGDAVMAVFYPDKEGQGEADERRALRAAMGMREVLAGFNRERLEAGLFEIDNGIGLNTGDVIIGSIGARKHRVDLTVIGDNVNIAARLESESKNGRHTKVVLSETTFSKVEDLVTVEPMTVRFVKGKSREVRMFEVVEWKKKV